MKHVLVIASILSMVSLSAIGLADVHAHSAQPPTQKRASAKEAGLRMIPTLLHCIAESDVDYQIGIISDKTGEGNFRVLLVKNDAVTKKPVIFDQFSVKRHIDKSETQYKNEAEGFVIKHYKKTEEEGTNGYLEFLDHKDKQQLDDVICTPNENLEVSD